MRLSLRPPWRNGTTALVFDPVSFLGRLAVLVPRPRVNLVLYYGVLGARSAWRAAVVPGAPREEGDVAEGSGSDAAAAPEQGAAGGAGRGSEWAALMARTFGLDVLACPRCGGRLRLVAHRAGRADRPDPGPPPAPGRDSASPSGACAAARPGPPRPRRPRRRSVGLHTLLVSVVRSRVTPDVRSAPSRPSRPPNGPRENRLICPCLPG